MLLIMQVLFSVVFCLEASEAYQFRSTITREELFIMKRGSNRDFVILLLGEKCYNKHFE